MFSKYHNFVVVDVETGGLPSKEKRAVHEIALTEVAIVAVSSNLEIVGQAAWLVKPYKEGLIYSKAAEETSGISLSMCEEKGVDIKIVCDGVTDFITKYKHGSALPVMLGHNFIKFDSEFMVNLFEINGLDLFKYVQKSPEDTIHWSRLMWQESIDYKLGTCCQNAGIVLSDAHRALTDTLATAKLWITFMKNLRCWNGTAVSTITEKLKKVEDGNYKKFEF